jgi:hypothetical protein
VIVAIKKNVKSNQQSLTLQIQQSTNKFQTVTLVSDSKKFTPFS